MKITHIFFCNTISQTFCLETKILQQFCKRLINCTDQNFQCKSSAQHTCRTEAGLCFFKRIVACAGLEVERLHAARNPAARFTRAPWRVKNHQLIWPHDGWLVAGRTSMYDIIYWQQLTFRRALPSVMLFLSLPLRTFLASLPPPRDRFSRHFSVRRCSPFTSLVYLPLISLFTLARVFFPLGWRYTTFPVSFHFSLAP